MTLDDKTDVCYGTLIVGHYGNGKYLSMGYLRGITRDEDGDLLYEIVNALEGERTIAFVQDPYRVDMTRLPFMASVSDVTGKGIIGKVVACNGELATIYNGVTNVVDVNSIRELTPYFEETK